MVARIIRIHQISREEGKGKDDTDKAREPSPKRRTQYGTEVRRKRIEDSRGCRGKGTVPRRRMERVMKRGRRCGWLTMFWGGSRDSIGGLIKSWNHEMHTSGPSR